MHTTYLLCRIHNDLFLGEHLRILLYRILRCVVVFLHVVLGSILVVLLYSFRRVFAERQRPRELLPVILEEFRPEVMMDTSPSALQKHKLWERLGNKCHTDAIEMPLVPAFSALGQPLLLVPFFLSANCISLGVSFIF